MNKHERFDAQAHIDADENPFTCSGDVAGFTGDKLDWLTALSADPRIDARAFEVGFCIMQHVNKRTRTAFVSTETIGEKTNIPKRWIARRAPTYAQPAGSHGSAPRRRTSIARSTAR